MTIHWINQTGREVYEIGSVLIAYLAYPSLRDDEKRAELMGSLCSEVLRQTAEADLDWEITPQRIRPVYAFRDQRLVHRDLKVMDRRLRDRLVAARMVMPFLQKAATGKSPKLPPPVERLSVSQMATLVLEDLDQNDAKNVEARVWRPSKPVLHIAAAIAVAMDLRQQHGEPRTNVGDFLTDRSLLDWTLRTAEEYEAWVLKAPELRLTAGDLIQLRRA